MSELYERGAATLVASWEAYAAGAPRATVHRLPGAAAAVFPDGPERAVYNNALLDRGLSSADRRRAADAIGGTYADAGVAHYAVWVHETDEPMAAELQRRGYRLDTCTRAMAMRLDAHPVPNAGPPTSTAGWPVYRALLDRMDVPAGLLAGADPEAFHVVMAGDGGEPVAAGIAYDHDGDCGIYNVGTLDHARRRGLGTAVTARLLGDARRRGCRTASLQSTPMAERLYAALGFSDLGRFVEFVPGRSNTEAPASRGPLFACGMVDSHQTVDHRWRLWSICSWSLWNEVGGRGSCSESRSVRMCPARLKRRICAFPKVACRRWPATWCGSSADRWDHERCSSGWSGSSRGR